MLLSRSVTFFWLCSLTRDIKFRLYRCRAHGSMNGVRAPGPSRKQGRVP